MPAHKHSQEAPEEDVLMNINEKPENEVESDGSHSSSNENKEEYVVVKLSEVRKEVQCPICLGIIRKTRTVMECLHRFCRECIDKSMRLGNNECPACRTHCASRRSLRDDPNYDALIAAIYPDIDKYEEEEDEMTHNKQIQASIAQTLQRQTEALGKKRNAKTTPLTVMGNSRAHYQNSYLRRRRNLRNAGDHQVSNDNEGMNDNDEEKDSSSSDEETETKPRKCPKDGGEQETQFPQNSATTDADAAGDENPPKANREIMSASGTLAWGKNGQRSNTRVNVNNARSNRIARLVEHLRNAAKNDDELSVYLKLVPFNEQTVPSLERPYLCCKPTASVKTLCQYVALKTGLQADKVELRLVINPDSNFIEGNPVSNLIEGNPDSTFIEGERTADPEKDELRILGEQETLAELDIYHNATTWGYLVMAYKKKFQNSDTAGSS